MNNTKNLRQVPYGLGQGTKREVDKRLQEPRERTQNMDEGWMKTAARGEERYTPHRPEKSQNEGKKNVEKLEGYGRQQNSHRSTTGNFQTVGKKEKKKTLENIQNSEKKREDKREKRQTQTRRYLRNKINKKVDRVADICIKKVKTNVK